MPKIESHSPGTFCWIDLATSDAAAARTFYTSLFDWRAEDVPMPGDTGGSYTIFYRGDGMVGAMYMMTDEMKQLSVPPHWESYIAVQDVDAAAAKVKALGGKVNAPPFDVPGVARMAPVADADGAMFNLYQPTGEAGLQVAGEPNAYCWSELYTNEPSKEAEFYGSLLEWSMSETKSADGTPYYQFNAPQRGPVAGMMKIRKEWGPMPPAWATYFQVANLDDSLAKAQSLGGKSLMPPMDAPNVGRFALIEDPTGAHFLMIQMAG